MFFINPEKVKVNLTTVSVGERLAKKRKCKL